MKTLISCIILLAAGVSFAQGERLLINRVDQQNAQKPSRIEHKVCLAQGMKTNAPLAGQRTFSLLLDDPHLQLATLDYGSIHGVIKNLTNDTIRLIFKRQQDRETLLDPDSGWGWSTSVCFGETCLPATADSLPVADAFKLPGGEESEFKVNFTVKVQEYDSILVHMLLAAVGSSSEDTIGFWLKAVSGEPSAVSTDTRPKRSNILAIFPSPLIAGSAINVKIQCARDVNYRYSIFDPFAREVAFGTSQRKLSAGDNTVNITSLEGIESGSYLLKLNFSDGTSDTYPFTVLR